MLFQQIYSDYSWIKIKRYAPAVDDPIEKKYTELLAHHQKETDFLIKEVRKLAQMLDGDPESEKRAEETRLRWEQFKAKLKFAKDNQPEYVI